MKRNKNIKGVLESIPYIGINEEMGVIKTDKNTYSITALVSDINYLTMRAENRAETLEKYAKILNYFDDNFNVTLNIINRKINTKYTDDIKIKEMNDNLDYLREDFNKIISDSIRKGKGNIKKEIYLTISVKAKDYKDSINKLEKPFKEIAYEFKKIGSILKLLTIEERLELMHDIMNYESIGQFNPSFYKNDKKALLTSKSCIAPNYMKFENGYYMLNERYYKTLFIKSVGDTLGDEFINEIIETNLNVNISINLNSLDKAKSLQLVRRKLTDANSELINRRRKALKQKNLDVYIPEELEDNLETAKNLLEDLKTNSDKLFYTTILITVEGETKEELVNNANTIQRIGQKNDIRISTLLGQQEDGFQTTLVLGKCNLSVGRYFTTTESSIFIPYSVCDLIQKNGLFYGRNSTNGNPIIYDKRHSKTYAHSFILGTTGSGKSVAMKMDIIAAALSTNDEIYVIDPLGEYDKVVMSLGGEVLYINAETDTYLNMFDMDVNYGDGKALNTKAEYLLSVFDTLLGGLTISEKSILDRVITKTYRDYISSGFKKELTPTLKDFQHILSLEEEKESKQMATALEIYAKGSLNIFANKTNVNTNKRIISYNLDKLGDSLKTIGYMVIINDIMNRLGKNIKNNIPSRLYCDEFHLMANNELTADFFTKLYKIARHYHCLISSATQQITDVLNNSKISATIANSSFLQLLNQNSNERALLGKLLNLSDTQINYIKSSEKGYGLLIIDEESIIPFENIVPKNSKIYNLIRTDLVEEE